MLTVGTADATVATAAAFAPASVASEKKALQICSYKLDDQHDLCLYCTEL
jgi:hypothetical protein